MKNPKTGYPTPFFAYLTKIVYKGDNVIKKSTGTIPAPKVIFEFVDDANERYALDVPFLNQNGRVSNYLFGFLNSLANIQKFGYLKVYIYKQVDEKNNIVRYNLGLRNVLDWVAGSKNYASFENKESMVNWKITDLNQIPKFEFEEERKGRTVKVNNTAEHQQFFIDLMEEINTVLENQTYDIKTNVSASMNSSSKPATSVHTDELEEEEEAEFQFADKEPSNQKNEDSETEIDDLPF
jgi:hypothetical protein